MGRIILPNVLTTEERLTLSRLNEHNLNNRAFPGELYIGEILEGHVGKRVSSVVKLGACYSMARGILSLIGEDYLVLRDFKRTQMKGIFDHLHSFFDDKKINFTTQDKSDKVFLGLDDWILSVLDNLILNTIDSSSKNTSLSIDSLSEFPSDAVYIPAHATDYSEFIAFRVHDNGKCFPRVEGGQMLFQRGGFPTTQEEYYHKLLTTLPKREEHGFGLYFTGLVAKVLQAPVGIKSVPGDTTVSFYHPVYNK